MGFAALFGIKSAAFILCLQHDLGMRLDSKMVTIVKIFVLVTFVTRTANMYTQQESLISYRFHSFNHVVKEISR